MSNSHEIAALENEISNFQSQVRLTNQLPSHSPTWLTPSSQLDDVVASLQNDAENLSLLDLKASLDEAISELTTALNDLRPAPPSKPRSTPQQDSTYPPGPHSNPPKWSKENHPAFQPGYRRPGAPASPVEDHQASTTFQVNDSVLAKWVSGDKSFYPAKITSVTGSSAAPIYVVTFKGYGNTDTVRANDIKPISTEAKKRKADSTPAGESFQHTPESPGVISAAANIDPDLASQARKEPSKVSDGPPRPQKIPRKVKANKELEAGKNKWQNFQTKGAMSRASKKDSMFRTGESVNARGWFFQHPLRPYACLILPQMTDLWQLVSPEVEMQ